MQYIRIVVEESEDVEGRTKMTDKVIENNQVTVMGEVVSDFPTAMRSTGKDSTWWI